MDQKSVIEKYWVQYFEKDIYAKLDAENKNIVSIRLDSYGSIYPHEDILENVNFNPNGTSKKSLTAFSLYDIFAFDGNRRIISDNIQKLSDKGQIQASKAVYYKAILSDFDACEASKKNKETLPCLHTQIDSFYRIWDSIHLIEKSAEIAQTLRKVNYKKVMYFIHGYNVPYSLANVQLLSLIKEMKGKTIGANTNEILFVPIFWTSNANKNFNLESKERFDISNKTGISNGGLDNGISFMYYSNRAYYAAITFRKILNKLSNIEQSQYVFTHSLGATVATSALINTVTKLDITSHDKDLIRSTSSKEKLKRRLDAITYDIVNGFKEPIPVQPITVFMSAAAIPGASTFADIDTTTSSNFRNKHFFSSINAKDEMLTKEVAHLPFVNRNTLSASSLGCDIIDASKTKQIVENPNTKFLNSTFHYRVVSNLVDHDILTYLNQESYLQYIAEVFTGKAFSLSEPKDTFAGIKSQFLQEYLKLERDASPYLPNGKLKIWNDTSRLKYIFESRRTINTLGLPLMKILFEAESPTYFSKEISPITRELIHMMEEPYLIVLVERAIKEDNSVKEILFKQKILDELSVFQKAKLKKTLPYYSYENAKRENVKFVSIKTGNDLFAKTTENLDRDYTGSLLVEVGTDWLNPKRRRPLKSYQTILFGFDVFTPAFYDSVKFKAFNSYDSLDRPHASFQYFGWSKKGITKNNVYRWQYTAKFGSIGGRSGERFQTVLHQDVSNSLRPKGWDAQISNGGRLGWSLETGHEWQFYQSDRRTDRFGNLNASTMVESKFGSYMTNLSWGLELSNKSFANCNHNYIVHKVTQTVVSIWDRFAWNASIKRTYVVHNSMLEGYGIIDSDEKRIDEFTPKSIYYLKYNQVNRWLWTGNARVSLTTTFFTLFYNWYIFSPETKLGKLNSTDPRAKDIDLSKRWHHFAELGIIFNLNRY